MAKTKKTSLKERLPLNSSFLSGMKWDDSYVSLAVGLIVVILIAVFGVVFFQGNRGSQDTSSTDTEQSMTSDEVKPGETTIVDGKKTYLVAEGDTLWSIAEKNYKSGYNWVDIAKANNLKDPNLIAKGNKLTIPEVKSMVATVTITPEPVKTQAKGISGNSYTVTTGDDLWNISVRAYGDGYSWVKIAQANKLSNPNLIYSGNKLTLPR